MKDIHGRGLHVLLPPRCSPPVEFAAGPGWGRRAARRYGPIRPFDVGRDGKPRRPEAKHKMRCIAAWQNTIHVSEWAAPQECEGENGPSRLARRRRALSALADTGEGTDNQSVYGVAHARSLRRMLANGMRARASSTSLVCFRTARRLRFERTARIDAAFVAQPRQRRNCPGRNAALAPVAHDVRQLHAQFGSHFGAAAEGVDKLV